MPRPVSGLIGSNADGIHFTSVRSNNHIRNCYVTRTLDDALAMDSLYVAAVTGQSGPRQLTVSRKFYLRFPNGTLVNFVDSGTGLESTGATIVSQNPPDSNSPTFNGQVELTFDQDLPSLTAGAGMLFGQPAMRGSTSSIEDSIVEDIPYGRGVWIGGAQGITVQRNVFRQTSNGGIVLAQNTQAFPGPPVHDITVQDNSLERNLGPMASGSGTQIAVAAIIVESTDQTSQFALVGGNTNIAVLRNYIADSGRSGVWFGEANSGSIDSNLINGYYEHPELPVWGITPALLPQVIQDFSSPIVVHYSTAVIDENNSILSTPAGVGPVVFAPSSASFSASGGSGSFSLTTAINGFQWSAAVSDPWITLISPPAGSGSATIFYSVSANASLARSGNLTIAGERFTIQQDGIVTGNSAQFLKTDLQTQGNWRTNYGGEGYNILGDAAVYPTYAAVTPSGQSFWTWASSTTDPRALQKSAAADHVAATWYSSTSFTLDVRLNDGNPHQMALYFLDWDLRGRAQTVAVFDAQTGTMLDSRNVSNFTNGTYLVWTLTGHVAVQITVSGGINAVLSGLFFGDVVSSPPPLITQQPQNAGVTAGQFASFSVSASSNTALTYQWQSQAPGGSSFANVAGATASTYTTLPTLLSDNGTQFQCVVTNSSGSVTTNAVSLNVQSGGGGGTGTAFVTSEVLGTLRNNYNGWVGMSITVSGSPLTITALGRMFAPGNSGTHTVKLVDVATGADVAGGSAVVTMTGSAGQFVYASLLSPIVLNANSTYYVLSQETAGGDQWYDFNTTATTASAASLNGAVWGGGAPYGFVLGTAGRMYVPVDFQYTAGPPPPGGTSYVTSAHAGTLRNNFSGWVGMEVTVGSSPITVSSLGRMIAVGNNANHVLKLVNAAGGDIAGGSATVVTSGVTPGTFVYAPLVSPVVLNANTTYYLVSQESAGGDGWYDFDTTVQTSSAATVTSAVWAYTNSFSTLGGVGHSYVPVDFNFQ